MYRDGRVLCEVWDDLCRLEPPVSRLVYGCREGIVATMRWLLRAWRSGGRWWDRPAVAVVLGLERPPKRLNPEPWRRRFSRLYFRIS